MIKKGLILLLICFSCMVNTYAQKTIQYLRGEFNSNGAFDQWTAWQSGTFKNGVKIEFRAMLSASKKGCKITVETKNVTSEKIKLMVIFGYSIQNVSTQMTGFEKISVKPGEAETTTYVAGYCGSKGNDYKTCYSCDHEYKLTLQ
ncbi:MAG: hypothetical protein ABL872_02160 [Lacibacter sp.]